MVDLLNEAFGRQELRITNLDPAKNGIEGVGTGCLI